MFVRCCATCLIKILTCPVVLLQCCCLILLEWICACTFVSIIVAVESKLPFVAAVADAAQMSGIFFFPVPNAF